jgi:hypothetical protein
VRAEICCAGTPSRLHHFSASDLGRRGSRLASVGRLASVRRRGHCASGRGRGLHRRTSGRRGSGPRPSCRPTLDPTTGRGTSDNPGTARVGPGRRQPPPNPRALNRRSLRPLMLRLVRCFSCREYYPIQCERILLRLLIAASSFVDAALGGDPDGLAMARTMAFGACGWACPDCPDD